MTYRRIRFGQIGNEQAVTFAVQELRRYLKKMDPELVVDVLQTEREEKSFGELIWVGQSESLAAHVPPVKDAQLDDAIAIEVKDGCGYITGSNARSVLIAAYRFLKELGCEFVRPGEEGERIPQHEIRNLQVSVHEAASYRHRGVCIEGADTYENILDMIDYLPKAAMNEYFIQFLVPATFFERWYWHESNPYLEKEELTRQDVAAMVVSLEAEITRRGLNYHKTGHGWTCEPFGIDGTSWDTNRTYDITEETRQYLAQVNGKRELWGNVPLNTNLCYSNPQVRGKMVSAITQYCKENPQVDTLHFWLADGSNNHCECEECVKKRPADWYVQMLNELDERMTAEGVSTKVVFLIYVDLLWEPVQEHLKNPERFILMFAPITRKYGECYGDCLEFEGELPQYQRNHLTMPRSLQQNLEHLRRWQKEFSGDSFDYDYHMMWAHVMDPGYEKCAKNVFQDMKDLHRIGINGMLSCQVQRCFFPTALPFVMMAAALWDEKAEFEEKALAYYEAAFGEDGAQVHRYLGEISELMLAYEGEGAGPICQDYAALQELITAFQPVIEKNLQKSGACRKEWELLQFHSAYVSALASCVKWLEKGELQRCAEEAEQLFDLLNRNELAVQKTLDVQNVCNILRRRLLPEK